MSSNESIKFSTSANPDLKDSEAGEKRAPNRTCKLNKTKTHQSTKFMGDEKEVSITEYEYVSKPIKTVIKNHLYRNSWTDLEKV